MAYLRNKTFQLVIGLFFLILSVQACAVVEFTPEQWEKIVGGFPSWYYENVPEYCDEYTGNQKKCSSGDIFACYQVGLALKPISLTAKNGRNQIKASRCPKLKYSYDEDMATNFFSKACDGGNGDSCFEAAKLKLPPFNTSYSDAVHFYEKGCDAEYESIEACRRAGMLYRDGEFVKQDFKKARKFFTKGCDANDSESCLNLADVLEKGQGFFFKSKSDAKELYGKLCDKGNLKGCENFKRLNQ